VRAPARLAAAVAGATLAVPVLVAGCGNGTQAVSSWQAPVAAPVPSASPVAPPASVSASASASASAPGSGSPSAKPPTTLSGPLSLGSVSGKVILVDPGHNGGNAAHPDVINRQVPMGTGTKACDTTGTETNGGYQEAAFTFDVASRLAALLRAAGANVVMTRTNNTGVGPCVDERAALGNDHHAAVAVSIHGDGGPFGGHGFHVLEPARVGAPSNAIVTPSHQLALKIRDSYRARTGIPASNYIGKDGISTRGDMGGLNLSVVPKVMVECGNMRSSIDAALMTNPTYRQRMAEGLAAGLAAYLAG
jgi:N-acetylmuramoyl-L-alanine amidase